MNDDELERLLRQVVARPDDATRAAGLAGEALQAGQRRRTPVLWAAGALAALVPLAAAAAVAAVLVGPGNRAVGTARGTPPPSPLPPPAFSPRTMPTATAERLVPGERLPGHFALVKFVSSTVGWGLYSPGSATYVLRSVDGGRTWRGLGPRPPTAVGLGPVGSAFFLDAQHAWVIGSLEGTSSTVYRTSNGGMTWTPARAATSFNPGAGSQLAFVDALHGWVADLGRGISQDAQAFVDVYRTLDGGATWQRVAHTDENGASPASGGISFQCGKQGIGFVSASVGWLTGGCLGAITFYETRDGGSTWARRGLSLPNGAPIGQAQCEAGPCRLSPPVFSTRLDGRMYFYGYDPSLASTDPPAGAVEFTTHDGGGAWQAQKAPASWSNPPFFVDTNHGWVIQFPSSASMSILATTNSGGEWQPVGPPFGGYDRGSLDFIDVRRGWLSALSDDGGPSTLLATADGGRTWSDLLPVYAGP